MRGCARRYLKLVAGPVSLLRAVSVSMVCVWCDGVCVWCVMGLAALGPTWQQQQLSPYQHSTALGTPSTVQVHSTHH